MPDPEMTNEPEPTGREPEVADAPSEPTPAQASSASPTPSQVGWWEELHPHLRGKQDDEVRRFYETRERLYGRQANELGTLRKQMEEYKEKIAKMGGILDKPQEPQAQAAPPIPAMSREEAEKFWDEIQNGDPRRALHMALGESFRSGPPEEKLREMMQEIVNENLRGFHEWQEQQALQAEPEWDELGSFVQTVLGAEDSFGGKRPARELYNLAKVAKTNPPLYQILYNVMMDHPNWSYRECKEYSDMMAARAAPSAGAKKVSDGATAHPRQATTRSQDEGIKTMDDAFNV